MNFIRREVIGRAELPTRQPLAHGFKLHFAGRIGRGLGLEAVSRHSRRERLVGFRFRCGGGPRALRLEREALRQRICNLTCLKAFRAPMALVSLRARTFPARARREALRQHRRAGSSARPPACGWTRSPATKGPSFRCHRSHRCSLGGLPRERLSASIANIPAITPVYIRHRQSFSRRATTHNLLHLRSTVITWAIAAFVSAPQPKTSAMQNNVRFMVACPNLSVLGGAGELSMTERLRCRRCTASTWLLSKMVENRCSGRRGWYIYGRSCEEARDGGQPISGENPDFTTVPTMFRFCLGQFRAAIY
jgi:hypothetical protein